MLVETKAKVAVFSIALGAYLPQFPELVPEFEQQYADFVSTLPNTVEKAAELYVAARAANGGSDAFLNVISDQGLKDTCRDFNIAINEAFVD